VQLAAHRTDPFDKPGLDIHVDVFQRHRKFEIAPFDVGQDTFQAADDGLRLGLSDNALFRQHPRMGDGAPDVVAVETLIEIDGSGEGSSTNSSVGWVKRPPQGFLLMLLCSSIKNGFDGSRAVFLFWVLLIINQSTEDTEETLYLIFSVLSVSSVVRALFLALRPLTLLLHRGANPQAQGVEADEALGVGLVVNLIGLKGGEIGVEQTVGIGLAADDPAASFVKLDPGNAVDRLLGLVDERLQGFSLRGEPVAVVDHGRRNGASGNRAGA
jgi:hypothetical protein